MTPRKIALVTPAAKDTRNGNRVTAVRWAKILRDLGHHVSVSTSCPSGRYDLLIAIHAWRSADAITEFKNTNQAAPVVVLLAGTDIYKFQYSHPATTFASLDAADLVIGLHDNVGADIPQRYHPKLRTIYQSYSAPSRVRTPTKRWLQFCVIAHMREEKDPLRAALATRLLPSSSRIRIVHLGGSHDPTWTEQATAEAASNQRYIWRGEVPRAHVKRCLSSSDAMIISSRMEGGANVVSEAIVCGLAVIASDISGNRGLLGENYPAYFKTGDEHDLAQLLSRFEHDPYLREAATAGILAKAPLFEPAREREAWAAVITSLIP